eukprot:TRINITY_DN50796_c0_g1_i1.p2 TRINITY_DN50796_c0_g1~~TRINITY_DN50796_c0_g1_i1.p2  ORF type:complete len:239 (+),score=128.07 TRINITY_DN50796_c0_g1_i1:108-719(+)
MPKNKGKGGKNRKRGTNKNEPEKRELTTKEEGQEYAQVLKMLGNGRLEVYCFDGQKRLAIIRGKMRKKQWMRGGDIILVGIRDFQDSKCDVIGKYNQDEARQLIKMKEIPDTCKINEDEEGPAGDADIVFDAGDSDDDDEDDDRGRISAQPTYWMPPESDSEEEDEEEGEGDGDADAAPAEADYDYKKYSKGGKAGGVNIDDI